MRKFVILIFLLSLITLITGAGCVTNSPFSDESKTKVRNSNSNNLIKLNEGVPSNNPLRFAIISDSHDSHDKLKSVVDRINRQGYDLVLHLGDFTNSGYNMEYDLFADYINDIAVPFFVIPGNHDIHTSTGERLFNKIFGLYNFTFEYKGVNFILFDNNILDRSSDFDWLDNQLSLANKQTLLFNHQPFIENSEMNQNNKDRYFDIFNNQYLKGMFHGHDHHYRTKWLSNGELCSKEANSLTPCVGVDGINVKIMQEIPRTLTNKYIEVIITRDNPSEMTIKQCSTNGCETDEIKYILN